MRLFLIGTIGAAVAMIAALGAIAACDDETATVRERVDAGQLGDGASTGDGGNRLACGVEIPTVYGSPSFEANTSVERAFRTSIAAIDAKLGSAEGESTTLVTSAELKALYGDGNPSLRAVSTPTAQAALDGYFDLLESVHGKDWTPAAAAADGGAPSGGKYDGTYMSAVGIDIHAAIDTAFFGGALYNHVLSLVAAPITDATVDRLVAAFGATPAFANSTNADAGLPADVLLAGYASERDDRTSTTPGVYRRTKAALLAMRAAVAGGDKCAADLTLAVAAYLGEWERAVLANGIFHLSSASAAAANPATGGLALRRYGAAYGFIVTMKTVAADKRKIQDAQIDALTDKIGATTAFKLVTNPGDRALALGEAVNDITLYEAFTPAEVTAFEKGD